MSTETRSTCPYCGVGCGVIVQSETDAQGRGRITGVRGDPEHPANFGRLCSKGSTLHLTAQPLVMAQTRLTEPLLRAERGAAPAPVAWDAALELAADRFADIIRRDGPDAVGLYVSGQLLTEDYYVFNKLAKGLVGSNNIDSNSRLCMSSAVAGYKTTLGSDAPPACYDDLALADLVMIAGSNTAWAHPILFRRLEDARRARPQQKLVVIDPRRTETAAVADLHLQLLPGSDVALFNGLLHWLIWEGKVDHGFIAAHTAGFDALRTRVREATPAATARLTGLTEADIVTAARWIAEAGAFLSLYCQGLNQSSSGTAKNAALINLHLATGQIGKPGAGPLSLTGQPNAMGGREVGAMANLMSGHRDLAKAADRAELAALWGVPEVPATPGRTAIEMFEAAAVGEIKALWIACTNPAQSLPDQALVRRALARCEFVVLQEAYGTTATAAFADLLLPASSWGEKSGTVTNSERRISRVRAAIAPPGQARADWAIAADFARRLATRIAPGREAMFAWPDPEAVWLEHRATTVGRDLDIGGLSWALLDEAGPQQWPLRAGAAAGQARLYADGVFPTPDGRARFADVALKPVAEPRDARYPFSLNTGRLRDQWHGMSRTGTLGRLYGHDAEPAIEMHVQDMARLGLKDGELARVESRRGAIVLPVRESALQRPTQVYVPMHWGSEVLMGALAPQGEAGADTAPAAARTGATAATNPGSTITTTPAGSGRGRLLAPHPAGAGGGGINTLTLPAMCPQSRQPELKHAAVRISPAGLGWQLHCRVWLPAGQALALRERLRPLLQGLSYAVCLPFGREGDEAGTFNAAGSAAASEAASAPASDAGTPRLGLALTAAHSAAPASAVLAALRRELGLAGAEVLVYADEQRGEQRVLKPQRLPTMAPAAASAVLLGAAAGGAAGSSASGAKDYALAAYWLSVTPGAAQPAAQAVAATAGRLLAHWRDWLDGGDALPGSPRDWLAPGAAANATRAARPRQVCTCFDVDELRITARLASLPGTAAERLAALQGELRCGSNCGSCLPALRTLVAATPCRAEVAQA
ncbi:MAG: hypothetical protein RIQ60_4211 [Pseudomonadota bacterium]|jgi:assimilatory nitrate reductase catalytic subunit